MDSRLVSLEVRLEKGRCAVSARLTNQDRERILVLLDKHAFDGEQQALTKESNVLAILCWREKYTEAEQTLLHSAPTGFFPEYSTLTLNHGGRSVDVAFREPHPLANCHSRHNFLRIEGGDPLYGRVAEFKAAGEDLKRRRIAAVAAAGEALLKFRTRKQAREGWPELETLCPKLLQEPDPFYPVAISRTALNDTFKLPVEKTA